MVLAAAAILAPQFYSSENLSLILRQIGIIGITAIGQTLVLLVAGIDLSVGAVIGLTMVVVAQQTGGANAALPAAVALAFALGAGIGLANAAMIVGRRVPPFVATFAMFILVQGALLAWTKGAPSGRIPSALGPWGSAELLGIPVPALIFAATLAVAAAILGRTTYGRAIYATGNNATAARLSGIPTGPVIASAYLICALLAVVAGLLISGYTGYVDNELIGSLNLDSIAAAVVGGTSLAGGQGGALRAAAGAVLIACLVNLMLLLDAGTAGQLILEGLVIVFAAWLQTRGRAKVRTL